MNYGTPEEWIKWYENKTGDKFELQEGYVLHCHERRGIMSLKAKPESGMIVVGIVAGDGRFWHDVVEVMARMNGFRCIGTICTRSVEAYIRFWRYKIRKVWDKNGEKRYLVRNRAGCYAVLTYRGKDNKTGVDTYWVTQYMQPGDKPRLED